MKPVRTARSNFVYVGPTPDVSDLHCRREQRGHISSVWHLTREERARVARGANIQLEIFTEPIPPVELSVVDDVGIGEDAPEILDRLQEFRRRGVL